MSDSPPGFEDDWLGFVSGLDAATAARLADRAEAAPLFAHAYAFHLNFRFGGMTPAGLLEFAAEQGLSGVKIHVDDGEAKHSLRTACPETRAAFGAMAARLGLELHVETSSTAAVDLRETARIAHAVGARSMRFYPRHSGPVSQVLVQTVADLAILPQLDPQKRLTFTLEQHEDLKSTELLQILRGVNHLRLSLLFDFANMINAFETPFAALAIQAPHVTEVHIKDARVVPDRGGWAHLACATGGGHVPVTGLLCRLLLLGQDTPQVRAFALEEEEGYLAPAFRFSGEAADPVIPPRDPSETDPGAGDLTTRLAQEREAAEMQVLRVRAMLSQIARAARSRARN